jgi:hypothetical protein
VKNTDYVAPYGALLELPLKVMSIIDKRKTKLYLTARVCGAGEELVQCNVTKKSGDEGFCSPRLSIVRKY